MNSLVAIYDFELFPYALGDVLTWNIRTAIRCEELNREKVDIFICIDKRYPSGIYQRSLVTEENFEIFFSDLYGAFGTHPRLGNIHIFRDRDALIAHLVQAVEDDGVNAEALNDYLGVIGYARNISVEKNSLKRLVLKIRGSSIVKRLVRKTLPSVAQDFVRRVSQPAEEVINNYFIKCVHSHEAINQFAAEHGRIPLLGPSPGCLVDVDELISKRFAGKKIVPFHLRLRRLDSGYGGEHSYARDSDFIEWYDFLRESAIRHPDVIFIALGRLQEKPLELLKLPNVVSIRLFGLGLGHELTLMLRSDMFIGTSSGFAAFANFSSLPYFITRMNPGSCNAYAIPEGSAHLPFAYPNQFLIYEEESSKMLMKLLESGLGYMECATVGVSMPDKDTSFKQIDIQSWVKSRREMSNKFATTCRFYIEDPYASEETAFLLMPYLEKARKAWIEGRAAFARDILHMLSKNFSDISARLGEYQLLLVALSIRGDMIDVIQSIRQQLIVAGKGGEDMLELLDRVEMADGPPLENLRTELSSYTFDRFSA